MHTHSLPRALAGRVFAAPRDDEQELFRQINATLGDIRNKHTNDFGAMREEVGNLTNSLSAMQRQIEGGGGFANSSPTIVPVDADYTNVFASFVRKGDGEQRLAIAFGDFNAGYLINDRFNSTRVLRDPFTNKPFVQFYATRRVGAGLLDNQAIRLLRIPT